MKLKTLLWICLFLALSQQAGSHRSIQTQKPSEAIPGLWMENAKGKRTEVRDTIPLAFFNTTKVTVQSTVSSLSELGDIWIILQHEGREPKTWKLENSQFDPTLLQAIENFGRETTIIVTTSSEEGVPPKWVNKGLIL